MRKVIRRYLPIDDEVWQRYDNAAPGLMAAAVAYHGFLSLVPALAAFLTAASFLGRSQEALEDTLATLHEFLPTELSSFIADTLRATADLVAGQHGLVIVGTLILALWSGSRGTYAMMRALGRVQGMDDDRPIWTIRGIAVVLTVGSGLALVIVLITLVSGGGVAEFFAELLGIPIIEDLWRWLRFPVAISGLLAVQMLVYRWGPPRPFPGWWLAAVVSTILIAVASFVLGWYVANFGFGSSFGVLGTVAVVIVWLYVGAAISLFSAAAVGFGWHAFRHPEGGTPTPL